MFWPNACHCDAMQSREVSVTVENPRVSFQEANKFGKPVCIALQRFGFAVVDDAAFIEDHRTRRERQG
jgi:hypothetical protein